MNDTLEAQFEAAWSEVERQEKEKLSSSTERLTEEVTKELTQLLSGVRDSLTEDQRDIHADLDKLVRMVEQFQSGVEMWRLKATGSIKAIEEKQRSFALLVEETSIRAAATRSDSTDRIRKRAAETEERCQRILRTEAKETL